MESLGQEIGGERGQERDGDLHRRIVEMPLHPPHHHADEQAKRDPAGADQNKTQAGRA